MTVKVQSQKVVIQGNLIWGTSTLDAHLCARVRDLFSMNWKRGMHRRQNPHPCASRNFHVSVFVLDDELPQKRFVSALPDRLEWKLDQDFAQKFDFVVQDWVLSCIFKSRTCASWSFALRVHTAGSVVKSWRPHYICDSPDSYTLLTTYIVKIFQFSIVKLCQNFPREIIPIISSWRHVNIFIVKSI